MGGAESKKSIRSGGVRPFSLVVRPYYYPLASSCAEILRLAPFLCLCMCAYCIKHWVAGLFVYSTRSAWASGTPRLKTGNNLSQYRGFLLLLRASASDHTWDSPTTTIWVENILLFPEFWPQVSLPTQNSGVLWSLRTNIQCRGPLQL
jgi:hypothetical protein